MGNERMILSPNLGLNDEAVEGLAKKTGNARFAYDCYRRFVQMFAATRKPKKLENEWACIHSFG